MKKLHIGLSLALASTLSVANAADTLEEAFTNAKTSGQFRAFYLFRDYNGPIVDLERSGLAVGGHLKMETAPINGFSVGTAFYTTQDFIGVNTAGNVEPSLYGEGVSGYALIGEAYLKYATGNTTVTVGRQKLDTPLAGSDDARMLPNLFEAAVVANTDVADTTLIAAHVTKFAAGSFSNVYANDGFSRDTNGDITGISGNGYLSLHSGYGLNNISGKFMDMGRYAIGQDTDGVTAVAAIYKGLPNTTIQVWDYYAHDILNAIYAQADFKWKCLVSDAIKPSASVQMISESDVGDSLAGDISSFYYAVKLGASYGAMGLSAAYSETDDGEGVITPWGGMPAFTQGMVTRHMFFADTSAYKVAGSYNFKDLGVNLKSAVYYTSFDVGAGNGYSAGHEWTADEFGFDIQYYPAAVKNLQLRFRGNFPRDFFQNTTGGVDWDEYRLIANYNF